ncbi:MAG TPA: hypothetical protein PLW02_10955, partial [Verrucomicrobiota bacterium]|nr:hypothetical protein [Verrucomicrobiota bacterium]
MRKLLLRRRLIKGPIGLIGQVGLFIVLAVTAAFGQPANDNFDNAAVLVGSAGTFSGSTTGATIEPGEPNHWNPSGGHSVWHSWTAPYDGPVSFDTVGSYFDTVLAVYTGNSVAALTLIGNNDDYINLASRVSFTAVAGTQYKIAVDSYSSTQSGLYILNWRYETQQTNTPAPPLAQNQIQFAQNAYTVQENTPGFVKIYVYSGGGNTAPISVNYATSNGT